MGRGALWLTRRECGHLHFDVSCNMERWTRVWAIFDKIRRRKRAFDSNVFDCDVVPALASRGRYVRNDRGGIRELIGVAIDITAQVEADLQLGLQREEMARMSRVSSMGELTASLAHELNQPLTAIASNAAAGRRLLAQGSPDLEMCEELLAA